MHFFTRFHRMLLTYFSVGWTPTQLAAMQSLYRPLKESTMDFVDLMDLPYQDVLACKCCEPLQHLAADGITASCECSMLHLEGGWLPQQPEEGAPLMQSRSRSPYGPGFLTVPVCLPCTLCASQSCAPQFAAPIGLGQWHACATARCSSSTL
jgi:hypothetical protein